MKNAKRLFRTAIILMLIISLMMPMFANSTALVSEDYFEETQAFSANSITGEIIVPADPITGHFGGFNSHRFTSTVEHDVFEDVDDNGWFWQSGTDGDSTAVNWGHIGGATTAFVQNPIEIYFTAEQDDDARPLLVFNVETDVADASTMLLVHCTADLGVYDVLNNAGALSTPLAGNWTGFWGPVGGHDISVGNLAPPSASNRTFHFLTDRIGSYTITVAVVDAADNAALLLGPETIEIEITPVPVVGNAALQQNLERGFDMFDFANNITRPVFSNVAARMRTETVWVEVPIDSDFDGERDLMRALIRRPVETLPERGGLVVPSLISMSPYAVTMARPTAVAFSTRVYDGFPDAGLAPTQFSHARFLPRPDGVAGALTDYSHWPRIFGPENDRSYAALRSVTYRRVATTTEALGPEAHVARYALLLEHDMLMRQDHEYTDWHRVNFHFLPPARTPIGTQRDGTTNTAASFNVGPWTAGDFVPHGYAMIQWRVMGSEHSQGMLQYGMYQENLVGAAIIDWLNGRVQGFTDPTGTIAVEAYWATGYAGAGGTSYDGTLPIAAAVTGVEGLRTIVPSCPVTNAYNYFRENSTAVAPGGWQGEDIAFVTWFTFGRGWNLNSLVHPNAAIWDNWYDWIHYLSYENDVITGNYNPWWDERNQLSFGYDMRTDIGVIMDHGLQDGNVKFRHTYLFNEMLKYYGVEVVKSIFHQGGHSAGHNRAGSWFTVPVRVEWLAHFLYGVDNDIVERTPNYSVESNRVMGQWTNSDEWPRATAHQRFYPTGGRAGELAMLPQTAVSPLTYRDVFVPNLPYPVFDYHAVDANFPANRAHIRNVGYQNANGWLQNALILGGHGDHIGVANPNVWTGRVDNRADLRWREWLIGGATWDVTGANGWIGQNRRLLTANAAVTNSFDFEKEIEDRLLFTMELESDLHISGVIAMTAEVAASQDRGVISAMLFESGTIRGVPDSTMIVAKGNVNVRNPNPAGTLAFQVPGLSNIEYGGNWHPNFLFQPTDIVPGNFYSYTWEMDVTEYTFTEGNTIGLIIFGSCPETTVVPKDAADATTFTVNIGPNTFLQLPVVGYVPTPPPVEFNGTNPNNLRTLLVDYDAILSTRSNLGIFVQHSPFVIPAGRTLYVQTTLNIQGNAEIIVEGNLVVLDGGRINNQGGSGGTITIAPGGSLVNNGRVENVTNSTFISNGTIVNNGIFQVRAGTTFANNGELIGELTIHRDFIPG